MKMTHKNLLALFAALALALPVAPAFAKTPDQGGFQGPYEEAKVTTVAAASKSRDDTPVTLTGNIVKQLAGDDDNYLFRDTTGEIVVDIDHHVFRGQTVTPETKVRIHGEVDKDMMEPTKIDVDILEVL